MATIDSASVSAAVGTTGASGLFNPRPGMKDLRFRKPVVGQSLHACPREVGSLAAPLKRALPKLLDAPTEGAELRARLTAIAPHHEVFAFISNPTVRPA